MKSYFLKIGGEEQGPYSEAQVAQLIADGQVNRETPARSTTGGDWRTVDDYFPTLKYGTELPAASSPAPAAAQKAAAIPLPLQPAVRLFPGSKAAADFRVKVVDLDLPFSSILWLMVKFYGAALLIGLCLIPVMLIFGGIVMSLFAGLMSSMMGHR